MKSFIPNFWIKKKNNNKIEKHAAYGKLKRTWVRNGGQRRKDGKWKAFINARLWLYAQVHMSKIITYWTSITFNGYIGVTQNGCVVGTLVIGYMA